VATIAELHKELVSLANPKLAVKQLKFYKTQKGEYGQGDRFLGVRVPDSRRVAAKYVNLTQEQLSKLAANSYHEVRFVALVVLVTRFGKTKNPAHRKEIFDLYIDWVAKGMVNNWDLVDASAPYIGTYLLEMKNPLQYLRKLGKVQDLWTQRVSILFLFPFIRSSRTDIVFQFLPEFISHPHDLIHKACGWMLREAGKRNLKGLREFLAEHSRSMPRTMLRYSIEKLGDAERQRWLASPRQSVSPRS